MAAVDLQGRIGPSAQSLGASCLRGIGASSTGYRAPRCRWSQSSVVRTVRPRGTRLQVLRRTLAGA